MLPVVHRVQSRYSSFDSDNKQDNLLCTRKKHYITAYSIVCLFESKKSPLNNANRNMMLILLLKTQLSIT